MGISPGRAMYELYRVGPGDTPTRLVQNRVGKGPERTCTSCTEAARAIPLPDPYTLRTPFRAIAWLDPGPPIVRERKIGVHLDRLEREGQIRAVPSPSSRLAGPTSHPSRAPPGPAAPAAQGNVSAVARALGKDRVQIQRW